MDTNWNFRSFSLVMKYSFDLKKTIKKCTPLHLPSKSKTHCHLGRTKTGGRWIWLVGHSLLTLAYVKRHCPVQILLDE